MRGLYNNINNILNQMDFNALWKGFKKYPFALYNEKTVYFEASEIPYNTQFIGNTSIIYNKEPIAIWYVSDPSNEDPEILASNLVHEMFHAFQKEQGESRFPNDFMILDYPDDVRNYELKYAENQILAQGFLATDIEEKRNLLQQFISIRNERKKRIGDMIQCEFLTETVEGLAEYVGTMALKQISKIKYTDRINTYLEILKVLDNNLFDIRRISYYIGTVFYITAVDSGVSIYPDLGKCIKSTYEMIACNFTCKETLHIQTSMEVKEKVQEHVKQKVKQLEDFMNRDHRCIIVDCTICGYDPMNMIKVNEYILCSHFIMLCDNQTNEQKFIKGPVLLEMKKDTMYQVISYYELMLVYKCGHGKFNTLKYL